MKGYKLQDRCTGLEIISNSRDWISQYEHSDSIVQEGRFLTDQELQERDERNTKRVIEQARKMIDEVACSTMEHPESFYISIYNLDAILDKLERGEE